MTPSLPTGPHAFQSAGEGPEQADRVLPAQGISGSWQTGGVGEQCQHGPTDGNCRGSWGETGSYTTLPPPSLYPRH